MKKFMLLLLAAMGFALAAQAGPAAAATGLFRVGAFAEQGPDGQVQNQGRIAVNFDTGDVYVADRRTDQISVYRQNGAGADLLTSFGSGDLTDPLGVAIDQDDGTVYVSDADGVTKYDSDNAPTPTFTADGTFAAITATGPLAFDQSADQLVLADTTANIVRRYSANGTPGATFDGTGSPDTFGTGSTFTLLQDLGVDTAGDVIVVDAASDPALGGSSRIERFSAAGTWKDTIGPVDQAATVGIVPATGDVIVGGNQDAGNSFELPTLTRFAAYGTRLGTLRVDDAAAYGTTSGIAVDDGPDPRVNVGTDVSLGDFAGSFGLTSVQNYDWLQLPTLTTVPASDITPFSATINGKVNPEGAETTYRFETSTDAGTSWTPVDPDGDGDESAGAGTTDIDVSASLTGLTDNTEYRFRLVATRGVASATSAAKTFTTTGAPDPAITPATASAVTATTATLTGTINPGGVAVTYQVEYRQQGTTVYTKAPEVPASAGSGSADVPFSVALTRLRPNTSYEWRVVAKNAARSVNVGGPAFVTEKSAPRADTIPATSVTPTSVRLNGLVDTFGQDTTYHFEYGLTASYGTVTPTRSNTGNRALRVFAEVEGLTAGQTIHYRVVATNATGTTTGVDQAVTLPADQRGYELASPPDKGGNDLSRALPVKAAANGAAVWYGSFGSFPGAPAAATYNFSMSWRDANGWDSLPQGLPLGTPLRTRLAGFQDVSDDLSHGFGGSDQVLAPGAKEGNTNLYVRNTRTGAIRYVGGSPDPALEVAQRQDYSILMDGTEDFSHVLVKSRGHLTDDRDPNDHNNADLYVLTGGEAKLASVGPDGEPVTRISEGTGNFPGGDIAYMSDDARRVFFAGYVASSTSNESGLFMRVDGTHTEVLSNSRRTGEEGEMRDAKLWGVSEDGRKVVFTTRAPLLNSSTYPARPEAERVYRLDVDTHQLEEVYVEPSLNPGDVRGLRLTVSRDTSSVLIESPRADHPGADVKYWRAGSAVAAVAQTEAYVNQADHTGETVFGTTMSPDGKTVAFTSMSPLSPDHRDDADCAASDGDNRVLGRCLDLYVYDAESASLSCATCDPLADPVQPVGIGGAEAANFRSHPRSVDDSGGVFVSTARQLSSEDQDGAIDVYYIRGRSRELITPGTTTDTEFGDASADGGDIYVFTRDRLVGIDTDDLRDLYVARRGGGGLPSQQAPTATTSCAGDACQGTATGAPTAPVAASVVFAQAGNGPVLGRPPTNLTKPTISRPKSVRGTVATIKVKVKLAGVIRITGPGLRTVSRTAARAGTYSLRVRLTATFARKLRAKGTKSTSARVSFTARSQKPQSATVRLTFKGAR